MELIRAFIAIELPDDIKLGLNQLETKLKSVSSSNIKWVKPDNIHLTLKFLGNMETSKIDGIVRAMQDSVQNLNPFWLSITKLGVFPNLNDIQVVWIGLDGELDTLRDIQKRLELNMIPFGIPSEKRSFTAHLTLARLSEHSSYSDKQALANVITKTNADIKLRFNVDSLNLMKSQLNKTGAVYTRLRVVEMKSPC